MVRLNINFSYANDLKEMSKEWNIIKYSYFKVSYEMR